MPPALPRRPTFDGADGGQGILGDHGEKEEDIEVEINDVEPVFLRGQTEMSKEMSPVRITKNPDGSMNRAAMTQSTLAKERRELRQAQANALIDGIPKVRASVRSSVRPVGRLEFNCNFEFFEHPSRTIRIRIRLQYIRLQYFRRAFSPLSNPN